jgi:hypothetical protein
MVEITNKILQEALQSNKDFTNESQLIITTITINDDKNEKFIIDSIQMILMKESARFMLYSECLEIFNKVTEQLGIYAK